MTDSSINTVKSIPSATTNTQNEDGFSSAFGPEPTPAASNEGFEVSFD